MGENCFDILASGGGVFTDYAACRRDKDFSPRGKFDDAGKDGIAEDDVDEYGFDEYDIDWEGDGSGVDVDEDEDIYPDEADIYEQE